MDKKKERQKKPRFLEEKEKITDPQEQMEGPVSSIMQNIKENVKENNEESKEEADRKMDKRK